MYQWTNAHAIYPDRGKKSYRLKRLRYRLRSLLHAHYVQKFTDFVNQRPDLAHFLNQKPNYSYPLVHRFLDKRFSAKQRFHAVCENLILLPNFFWQQPLLLGEVIPDFELYLGINQYQPMEGYWALELRAKENDELIYLLTFGKVENALLIAVIQGPNFEGSKEMVKQLTKKCHGLRPAYLMVEVMKALTQTLGYEQLWGIPQQFQNKSRLVQSKRYVVDYDQIFQESGAIKGNYWQLPTTIEMKDLSLIASNKRSMYRKRYEMLNHLQRAMTEKLAPLCKK
ncbi:hypothetical protein A4G19_05200 [Pasteurellaceae bacterium Macca]|nr:hypothetical protein [Pasteurellaceae bacterium Macca]